MFSDASLPSDRSSIRFERFALDGSALGYIAYGIHATLFAITCSTVWKQRSRQPFYAYGTLAYIFILFALGTIANFSDMHYVEQQFVNNRDYPGGPVAYQLEKNGMKALPAYSVNMWFVDAMMVFRFAMIFQCQWWVIAIPTFFFLASIVLSIITLVCLLKPGQTYITASKYSTGYFSISIGTTVFLTLAIVARLMIMRRRVARVMRHNVPDYLSVSAMLVESAFVYSAVALPHAVLNALNNPGQLLTFHVLGQVQSIAPLLIIYRVAQKRAWTRAIVVEAESLANYDWNLSHVNPHHGQSPLPAERAPRTGIPLNLVKTDTQDDRFSTMKFAERPPSADPQNVDQKRASSSSEETRIPGGRVSPRLADERHDEVM